jgi:hypothetical protein
VEFCEADVLDVFDEWRRSVGVGARPAGVDRTAAERENRRRESLSSHLEKLVARLTMRRGGANAALDMAIDTVVREIDAARAGAKSLRGERREALLNRLRDLDAVLLAAARQGCDADTLRDLSAEADTQLAPFRDRMTPAIYAQSHQACVDRLVREHARLPAIAFD